MLNSRLPFLSLFRNTRLPSCAPLLTLPFLLGGCFFRGASNFPMAGAYFPGWLICFCVALISAALFRALFLFFHIDAKLDLRLFTYLSLGAIVGLVTWKWWFGP
ncbi:hypothetical protein GS501_07700 [Saccharibacter sp. 17.LH.SD]|nr:hypothetical protein [Saccharibacter sp. 17.LH.SD]